MGQAHTTEASSDHLERKHLIGADLGNRLLTLSLSDLPGMGKTTLEVLVALEWGHRPGLCRAPYNLRPLHAALLRLNRGNFLCHR